MKIEIIPKGKENKINRQELMKNARINDEQQFKSELAEIKKKYIVLYDEGYYRPKTKEEYENFIRKCNTRKNEAQILIELAKNEMEGLNDEKSR